MGRRPADGIVRDVLVQMKLTKAGAAELDRLRGTVTRPDYMRKLLKEDSDRDRGKGLRVVQ